MEMFKEKDISELKSRVKAQTIAEMLRRGRDQSEKTHRKQTYQGKLEGLAQSIEDISISESEEENSSDQRMEENGSENQEVDERQSEEMSRTGNESENETLKNEDEAHGETLKESTQSFKSQQELIKHELLSNPKEKGRESQESENFSFKPKNLKQNMDNQMKEMMEDLNEVQPVKKNITASIIIDQFEDRKLEDLQHLRDKAHTQPNIGKSS